MILLFGVGLYFLTRGSLNATVASAVVITAINVALLLVLSAMAFSEFRIENLTYVNLPWTEGNTFAPILLGALVGVILDIYAAHILVAIFCKMLLDRDPGGRSVVRGHAAGIGFEQLGHIPADQQRLDGSAYSMALAVGPVLGASDEEMSVSLGTVFILNAIALFVLPVATIRSTSASRTVSPRSPPCS